MEIVEKWQLWWTEVNLLEVVDRRTVFVEEVDRGTVVTGKVVDRGTVVSESGRYRDSY